MKRLIKRFLVLFSRKPIEGGVVSGPVFKPIFTSIAGDCNGDQDSNTSDIDR
jgi:hypothetical protein